MDPMAELEDPGSYTQRRRDEDMDMVIGRVGSIVAGDVGVERDLPRWRTSRLTGTLAGSSVNCCEYAAWRCTVLEISEMQH